MILVREQTKPEGIHGFFASQGILTSRGGKTLHAAVVARGMGKPCVAGAEGIKVDVKLRQAEIGDKILREGDYLTIDGGTGFVCHGIIPTVEPTFSDDLKTLLSWADEVARLKVFANADTPGAADKALTFGDKRMPLVVQIYESRDAFMKRLEETIETESEALLPPEKRRSVSP